MSPCVYGETRVFIDPVCWLIYLTGTIQSSAELSEAVNSMWKFYQQADMCVVFLFEA